MFTIQGLGALLLATAGIIVSMGPDSCILNANICKESWQSWNGSCYFITSTRQTWNESHEVCRALGGKMAAPQSHEEAKFMNELQGGHMWIACSKLNQEQILECDGQEKGHAFINNLGSPRYEGHCVTLYTSNEWHFHRCTNSNFAVCVKPVKPLCVHHQTYSTNKDTDALNHSLVNHVIREFPIKTTPRCAAACTKMPTCRSFNVNTNNQGDKVCQLNDATRLDDPASFQLTNKNCIYYTKLNE